MALKLKNDRYLKLLITGEYFIYESEQNRDAEKKVISSEKVLQKYSKIIQELKQNKEQYYYDPEYRKLVANWETEALTYSYNALYFNTSGKYPLMKKHIKNIEKSIPKILFKGTIQVKGDTLEEVYAFVKKYKIFGETEDI